MQTEWDEILKVFLKNLEFRGLERDLHRNLDINSWNFQGSLFENLFGEARTEIMFVAEIGS